MTLSTPSGAEPIALCKKTAANRQRKDPLTRPVRMARVTTRNLEGRYIRDVRKSLLGQLGDYPSPAQRILVERCVMLSTQLARMDAKSLRNGAMSGHAVREYLSWNNALSRLLRQLGLKNAPPKVRTLDEIRAAGRAAA